MDLTGKRVLVTGGCGTIGSHLVRRILEHDPHSVRIFDTNERALFDFERSLSASDREKIRPLLGNVRDRDRLSMAIDGVDVVFHAAALKHVELNEYNPFEAVQTNVQGTQNLVRIALEEEVEAFVGISTDKASNPTSVMGATKLLAERLIVAGNTYKGGRQTTFGCVRFGNVLGSSGSVVPIFLDQIAEGGPITVTDPEMTRFIMPVERAVDLTLQGLNQLSGGEVFVLKMPAMSVGTLAETVRDRYAPEYGYDPDEIDVEIVGPRPGERKHEKLISLDELPTAEERASMFVLHPQIDLGAYTTGGGQHSLTGEYSSEDAELLDPEELVDMLEGTQSISIGVSNGGNDGR